VEVDPHAADLPVDAATAERALQAATVGVVTGALADGPSRRDVRVRLGGSSGSTPAQLESLQIPIRGGVVPLSQVGHVKQTSIPDVVVREGGRRQIRVWLRLSSENVLGAVRGTVAAGVQMPPGVTIVWE